MSARRAVIWHRPSVVELTIALHLALDLPKDKLIWDVGHQAYTHKLLTGRRDGFETLRQYGGIAAGFSVASAAFAHSIQDTVPPRSRQGSVMRRRGISKGEKYNVVSVIGDGSMTGGMAFEALNNAARLKSNFIIILNDNNMSISKNVGGMSRYLNGLRTAEAYTELKMGMREDQAETDTGSGRKDRVDQIRKTKAGSNSFSCRVAFLLKIWGSLT